MAERKGSDRSSMAGSKGPDKSSMARSKGPDKSSMAGSKGPDQFTAKKKIIFQFNFLLILIGEKIEKSENEMSNDLRQNKR